MKIFIKIVVLLLSVAYPVLWYFGREKGFFDGLALLMATLWLLRGIAHKNRQQQWRSLVLAAFFVLILFLRLPNAMYWYPVGVSGLMLLLFAGSLFSKQSMIERLARLQQPDLPEEGVAYTRKVTQVWCIFFIVNISITAVLIFLQAWQAWAWYTGFIAYVLMGLLFAGEWIVRRAVIHSNTGNKI